MTVLELATITAAGLAVIVGPPGIDPAAAHQLDVIDETRPEIAALEAAQERRGWRMDDMGEALLWPLERARMTVHIAEERLLELYGMERRPADDLITCESCPATDPDDFTTFEAGETWGDQICNHCLYEHAATRASDRANADAYYCR